MGRTLRAARLEKLAESPISNRDATRSSSARTRSIACRTRTTPARPALTNVPREEARRLCAERGARLCTELEWERACKGPQSETFAGGNAWDSRCAAQPNRCASAFDVLAMGAALREWTASSVIPDRSRSTAPGGRARSGRAAAPAQEHRCAQRLGIDPETQSPDLGFRCCKGAPNAAVVPEAKLGQTFRRAKISADRLSRLLAADPRTQALAKDVKFFREPEAANTVIERGPGEKKGFSFTVAPLIWNPVAGAEYLVLSARSGEDTSFVARVLRSRRRRVQARLELRDEEGAGPGRAGLRRLHPAAPALQHVLGMPGGDREDPLSRAGCGGDRAAVAHYLEAVLLRRRARPLVLPPVASVSNGAV